MLHSPSPAGRRVDIAATCSLVHHVRRDKRLFLDKGAKRRVRSSRTYGCNIHLAAECPSRPDVGIGSRMRVGIAMLFPNLDEWRPFGESLKRVVW